jgi:Fe-S cluster biogenesis protein NfuA
MMSAVTDAGPQGLVADVERLLGEVEALPDGASKAKAMELVRALVELYGAGLERMVEEVAARDGGELAEAFAGDELIAHLLLLHGLHPLSVDDRVRAALAEVKPYMESHGGDVELLGIDGSTVRLRLDGSCSGCPSSQVTLKLAVEKAIHKAAPEIEDVVAQDGAAPEPLLQIELARETWTCPAP